jgi:hypothetical protein
LDPAPLAVLFLGHRNVVDNEKLGMTVVAGKYAHFDGIKPTGNAGLLFAVRTDDHEASMPQARTHIPPC